MDASAAAPLPSAASSVHAAGITRLLPSGSTTSNSARPRRRDLPITGRRRPCIGSR
jgi:hypothetical protein